MRHTEAEYINAGAAYERAPTPDAARAHAQGIRVMLEAERPEDQTYARQMIEHGRAEVRGAPLRARVKQ